jgi:hypothetical protein
MHLETPPVSHWEFKPDTQARRAGFNHFKWPDHATVMKMFEQVNKTIGSQRDDVKSMPGK